MAIPIQASDPDVQIFTDVTIDVPGPYVFQLTTLTSISKIAFAVTGLTGDTPNDVGIDIATGEPGSEVDVIENIHWGDTDSLGFQGDRSQGWLIIPFSFGVNVKISARITAFERGGAFGYNFQIIAME